MSRRGRARAERREATSVDELVKQVARDKRLERFKPAEPGTERPRDVFLAAVDQLVEPLRADGYTYARSGPHASLRRDDITTKVTFASSTLNVAGALVSLRITLFVLDATLGSWRRQQSRQLRPDDVVTTRHLGHLLDPPRWLEWNLAARQTREATTADIARTLHDAGLGFVDRLAQDLRAGVDPSALAGRVDNEALIEHVVRAGRGRDTPGLIDAMLSRMRTEGLPDHRPSSEPGGLAFLVVQHDLPVHVR